MPSLLDWLIAKLGPPTRQRLLRGLATLTCGLWGGYLLQTGESTGVGWVWLVIAVGFGVWAVLVRGSALPPDAAFPELDRLPSATAIAGGSPTATAARPKADFGRAFAIARYPSALFLAMLGQSVLTFSREAYWWGLAFYGFALVLFLGALGRDQLLGGKHADGYTEASFSFRWRWFIAAGIAGVLAFFGASGNQFREWGVLAWGVSVVTWLIAVLEEPSALDPRQWWPRLVGWVRGLRAQPALTLTFSRSVALFALVFTLGAYFRFAALDTIPVEMTSDHVEKLFDVNDVLNGQHPVFFERNTGREPLQFYFAALLDNLFHTGVTHLTLKLTGAIAGALLLPTVYCLGRDLEDERFGLLAMALTGISFWATAISRVGLRFPLYPVFVAPIVLFLLRGLRHGRRNDFIWAGFFLGAGLYGYSPIRVMPLVMLALIVWFALWPENWARLRVLFIHTTLMFFTAFVVFLPLYRYATSPDNLFWYRSLSRLSETEAALAKPLWQILFENQWNVLRMFNWQGDEVWVNTLPGQPVLDWISGALLILGLAFLLARLVARRDKVAGALLLVVPLLLLPSSLAVAFPQENPSVVRASGAIPIIFVIAAYPLWLLIKHWPRVWAERRGRLVGMGLIVALGGWGTLINHTMYFAQYPAQYLGPAQNASEIGGVVRDFVQTFYTTRDLNGNVRYDYTHAWVCLHPHWADTRAIGLYAGAVGWEQVLPPNELSKLQSDSNYQLIIVNPRGEECISALRAQFPNGRFRWVYSQRGADKDFMVFLVPSATEVATEAAPK
jgi:hypothetical protein